MRAEPSLADHRSCERKGPGWMAVLLIGCAWLASCVSTPSVVGPSDDDDLMMPAESLVLDDLVASLEQLLAPHANTLQVSFETTALTEALIARLAAVGYGVQRVGADEGAFLVGFERLDVTHRADASRRYKLDVGNVSLSRAYVASDHSLVPVSALSIGGSDREVVLDDNRFGQSVATGVTALEYQSAPMLLHDTPLISLIAHDGTQARGDSFRNIRETFVPVVQQVVLFAEDSVTLDAAGMKLIERVVANFRESTDLIGFDGCGRSASALARSAQVAEALLWFGVAPERIVDDACREALGTAKQMSGQGVVVGLLRWKS